jgi:hypothetical protein
MKKTVLSFILLLTINSIYSQVNQKSDINKFKLNGLVKSIEQRAFRGIQKFGEAISGNEFTDVYDFNVRIEFDTNGKIISIINLAYEETSYDGRMYYTFVNGNQKVMIDGYYHPEEIYKYDQDNNMIEEKHYNDDGSLHFKVIYKYDNLYNLIETRCYDRNGVLESIEKSKYDSFGNVTEVKQFMPSINKTTIETIIYSFDKNNNWVKKIRTYEGELYAIIERKIIYY